MTPHDITDEMLEGAAEGDNLDLELKIIMDMVGIISGDVAGQIFADCDDWQEASYGERLELLEDWRTSEILFAEKGGSMSKVYRHTNPRDLEPHFSKHMSAMTSEDLHSKSEIAAELAHRDREIEKLRGELLDSATQPPAKTDAIAEVVAWTGDTDKELLKLAAKAAGIQADISGRSDDPERADGFDRDGNMVLDWRNYTIWNPLKIDSNALRLAATLRLKIIPGKHKGDGCTVESQRNGIAGSTVFRDDPSEQMRRAIVVVAAEIGRQLKGGTA